MPENGDGLGVASTLPIAAPVDQLEDKLIPGIAGTSDAIHRRASLGAAGRSVMLDEALGAYAHVRDLSDLGDAGGDGCCCASSSSAGVPPSMQKTRSSG